MARTQISQKKEVQQHLGKIAELSSKMVEITDQVLATEAWTREGEDARRRFRICVRQLQVRADLSGDLLIASTVYDSLERFKESCPNLFAQT
jgi:hypothetical protein